MYEIEAKLRVDSFDRVRDKLSGSDAVFCGRILQQDDYFDNDASDMLDSDRCLRIRTQVCDSGRQYLVTCKGARESGCFKKRMELEVPVSDVLTFRKVLGFLGFKAGVTVEKQRERWTVAGCEVCLDEVSGLGSFVEIEGPDEFCIENVQNKLALGGLKHVDDSYASLICESGGGCV